MKRLTQIANKHLTDKGTLHFEAHGYTEIYEDYISSKDEIVLLEIGIQTGASLKMWKEYNPNMKIYAIDINPECMNFISEDDYEKIFIGDATDVNFLKSIIYDIGKIDIIIDDGSHIREHILKSFDFLYDHLSNNGIYFIEDLHVHHNSFSEFISNFNEILDKKKLSKKYEFIKNNKLLKINKLVPNKNIKNIFVVSTYLKTEQQISITKKCLQFLKKSNIDILLVSHSDVPSDIIELCDYHIYDKNNLMCNLLCSPIAWYEASDFRCELSDTSFVNEEKHHSPAVYSNFFNGISFAKSLGYEKAICVNYDYILNPDLINKYIEISENKKGLFFKDNDLILTTFFIVNCDFFTELFKRIEFEHEYIELIHRLNASEGVLENLYLKKLMPYNDEVEIRPRSEFDAYAKETNSRIDIVMKNNNCSVLRVIDRPDLLAIGWTNSVLKNDTYGEFKNDILIVTINDKLFVKKEIIPLFEFFTIPYKEMTINLKITNHNESIVKFDKTYKIDDSFMQTEINKFGFLKFKK